MRLTSAEEQLMELLWQSEKAFMKDLIDAHPEPKPAPTTVATLLKRMIEKGAVAYTTHGNSRQYYPLLRKEDYFSKHVKGLIRNFFGNSTSRFASFFTTETDLSQSELEELRALIDQQIQNRKS